MTTDQDDALQALRHGAERALQDLSAGNIRWQLLDRRGEYDAQFWQHCRTQGWTGIGIPEAHGGLGLDLAAICVLAETCGAFACAAPFLELNFVVSQAILRHGDPAAQSAWLGLLASGAITGAVAFGEGADPLPPQPELRSRNGRLTGHKPAVPGAAVADLAVMLVAAEAGPTLALVDLRQACVTRTVLDTFDNSRCTADLDLADVPATLLPHAAGLAAAGDLLDLYAVAVAHAQIGGAAAMLQKARTQALDRHAFGQQIGTFQSVKHRIAEDYVLLELARASAAEAVAAWATPAFGKAAAAARLLAADAYETGARDAVQVHGGIGATWESDLHLHQRRARTLALELGSAMFWQDRLVERLTGVAA